MNKPLQALPNSTRNHIRSTQILTSLPQIVSELLQNALDAGARHVDVGIDRDDWSCWVRDDGHGMSKDNMFFLGKGSEQSRYATSKAYDSDSLNVLSSFGFRGEALASAADLCCLEIASRTANSRETWSIILKGGKCLYTGSAVRWRRESPGTTVMVRDAFYNLPIRRLSHLPATRTFELVRQEIETYALVFPNVTFTVERSQEHGVPTSAAFRIPKTVSGLSTFRHLFGKALVKHSESIDVTSGEISLEGFISLDGSQSKAHQFLYVNKHPISRGEFHNLIDSKFASSSFARHAYDESGETTLRSTVRRSPRKIEKRPVYVLNLTVPPRQLDNCMEPAKMSLEYQDKNCIVALLSSTIQSFLVRHGFLTHPSATRPRQEASPSPRKRRRREDFEGDSGYAESPSAQLEGDAYAANLDTEHLAAPLFIRNEQSLVSSSDLMWTDPSTGQIFVVDSRTGNSRPNGRHRPGVEETEQSTKQTARLTMSFPRKQLSASKEMPDWIQDALATNQVYTRTETTIPRIKLLDANVGRSSRVRDGPFHDCHHPLRFSPSALHDALPSGTSHRFRKDDLAQARVINQVDRKFIACLISGQRDDGIVAESEAGGRALVLIDQHAADERIRVERFLKPLCLGFLETWKGSEDKSGTVNTRKLSPAVPILLTSFEALTLSGEQRIQRALLNWGFEFGQLGTVTELSDGVTFNESGYVQVIVKSIPEVVADKLLLGDELRDVVKAFLADPRVPEGNYDDAQSGSGESSDDWLRALRWCPRELLDLVNSKACRGAIMFNDTLTTKQCQKLVHQLADTVFPFQCAHGRPSLIPLTDISLTGKRLNGGDLCWSRLEERHLD